LHSDLLVVSPLSISLIRPEAWQHAKESTKDYIEGFPFKYIGFGLRDNGIKIPDQLSIYK